MSKKKPWAQESDWFITKAIVLIVIVVVLILFALSQVSCAPAPTPVPTATATRTPAPKPTLAPTPDPWRLVWVWPFSAKYDKSPSAPVAPLSLTSYGIFEGELQPVAECPSNIFLGMLDQRFIMHETCRVGQVQRLPAWEAISKFPVLFGVYTENW